jgi:hypothetical protein
MPSYLYTCTAGHTHEEVRPIDERDQRRRCGAKLKGGRLRCVRRARRDRTAEMRGGYLNFIPDVPMHWNPTIGEGALVKSRKHLAQLQEQHGLMDFDPKDPKNQPSTGWQG